MDNKEIRLRILETLVPKASQVEVTNPERIVRLATELEQYVLGSKEASEDSPTSQTRKGRGTPRKGKASPNPDENPAPAHVG